MRSKDVIIGMAVIPHSKSAGLEFNIRRWMNTNALVTIPVMIVKLWDKQFKGWLLEKSNNFDNVSGLFLAKDFEPYTTPYKKVRFIKTGRVFRQYMVGNFAVYKPIDVISATDWEWAMSRWEIHFKSVVREVYVMGERFQAYEMDFGNLIEEIK